MAQRQQRLSSPAAASAEMKRAGLRAAAAPAAPDESRLGFEPLDL